MITLVKFIKNKQEDAPPNNRVISKTLGKTGVLSWEHIDGNAVTPQAEEFWYVEIMKEKGAGTSKGVFMLRPVRKVADNKTGEPDIVHMIPGTYRTERLGNTILLHPKILNGGNDGYGPNWICSLTMRRKIMNKYKVGNDYQINSIIVVFDQNSEWCREDLSGNSLQELQTSERTADNSMPST
jgi:hypothetical protein